MIPPTLGSLIDVPALDVLAACAARKLTGRLTSTENDTVRIIYLRGGTVVFARSNAAGENLRSLMVNEGRLPAGIKQNLDSRAAAEPELNEVQAIARSLGLPPDALRNDSIRAGFKVVAGMLAQQRGTWLLEEDEDPRSPGPEVAYPTEAVLCQIGGAAGHLSGIWTRERSAWVLDKRDDLPMDPQVMGLPPDVLRLWQSVDGVRTVEELLDGGGNMAGAMITVWTALGWLVPRDGLAETPRAELPVRELKPSVSAPAPATIQAPPATEQPAAAPPPAAAAPPPAAAAPPPAAAAPPPAAAAPPPAAAAPAQPRFENADAIKQFAATLGQRNHYQTLGIPLEADAAQVRAAYFNAAKVYHPDNFAGAPPDLLQAANAAFAAVTQAHKVLSDPAARNEYTRVHIHGMKSSEEEAEEHVIAALQADTHFKSGVTQIVGGGRYAEALKHFRDAYNTFPTEPVYKAAYAYALQLSSQGDVIAEAEAERLAKEAYDGREENMDVIAFWAGWQGLKGQTVAADKQLRDILKKNSDHRIARALLQRLQNRMAREASGTNDPKLSGGFFKRRG